LPRAFTEDRILGRLSERQDAGIHQMFVPFTNLNVGFSNAENYQRRENNDLLERYFVRDEFLEKILNPNIYYLFGEKGTGKTAYATFLRNNNYKNNKVSIFDIGQTEYQKFLELKRQGHLPLSQYVEVCGAHCYYLRPQQAFFPTPEPQSS
jgi:hypothetical protein